MRDFLTFFIGAVIALFLIPLAIVTMFWWGDVLINFYGLQ